MRYGKYRNEMEYWEMSGMYIMGYEWDIYGKKGFNGNMMEFMILMGI
jgi:hypothetical protein